jgi:hypothetical protein
MISPQNLYSTRDKASLTPIHKKEPAFAEKNEAGLSASLNLPFLG